MSAERPARRWSAEDRQELSRTISIAQRAAWQRLDNRARARLLLATQRHRDNAFGQLVFRELAFEILLDLYVAHPSDRTVEAVCEGLTPMIPVTTGLRYIAHLQDNGLLRRTTNPSDSSHAGVALTADALARLETYLVDPAGAFATE